MVTTQESRQIEFIISLSHRSVSSQLVSTHLMKFLVWVIYDKPWKACVRARIVTVLSAITIQHMAL
jgi:membrane-associated PAP2 superfamily phosphatase